MESLYKKLYEKYDKLKNKNLSELDGVNEDQELKFSNYVTAAEEYILFLKSENEKMCTQVNNLKCEVNSIRSTNNEQCLEYQKLLMEENQKRKALSEEVEKLQKLLKAGTSSYSREGKNDNMQLNTPEGAQTTYRNQSSGPSKEKTGKRRRDFGTESEGECISAPSGSGRDDAIAGQSAKNISKENVSCGDFVYDQMPECCKRTIDTSGGGAANCVYQALVEYLVGMKLSTFHQSEGICMSAMHQSSGYSFSLTWVKNEDDDEWELLYRMLSLGTFERVAPEWMKEVIMFSTNMCPKFFERMSHVIRLRN